jgi:hypothetical protein
VRLSPGKNSINLSAANFKFNFDHYSVVQTSATDRFFTSFPLNHLLLCETTHTSHILHRQRYIPIASQCSSGNSPQQPQPSTIHIPNFHQRKADVGASHLRLNLDMDQTRCARLSSGAAGGWDLKEEEYEGGKPGEEKTGEGTGAGREEVERRRPTMGRQRSRSAGEILRERLGWEFVYPAAGGGQGVRAGGDAEREVEEDERSVRLRVCLPCRNRDGDEDGDGETA